MHNLLKPKWFPVAATILVPLFLVALVQGCNASADQDDEQAAKAVAGIAPASLSVENGRTILRLDEQSQKRAGLSMMAISETLVRKQLEVPAVVLSAASLANLQNNYANAQTQLQKAQASLAVTSKEYKRLKSLYEENQNVSAKAKEAAEGKMEVDEAAEGAARQELKYQASIALQDWGPVISQWIASNAAPLQQLLSQREMLVQITIPPDTPAAPPSRISIIDSGEMQAARFISLYPRVDPRIQGRSYLYMTPARPEVMPGANLLARFAAGKAIRGFVIPQSAIVWSEGQAWIYRQSGANEFSRFAAATDLPVEHGYLMTGELSPGDRIVVRGAQALLSEELLLQGQGASAPDTD